MSPTTRQHPSSVANYERRSSTWPLREVSPHARRPGITAGLVLISLSWHYRHLLTGDRSWTKQDVTHKLSVSGNQISLYGDSVTPSLGSNPALCGAPSCWSWSLPSGGVLDPVTSFPARTCAPVTGRSLSRGLRASQSTWLESQTAWATWLQTCKSTVVGWQYGHCAATQGHSVTDH